MKLYSDKEKILFEKVVENKICQSEIENIVSENDFTEEEYIKIVEDLVKNGIDVLESKDLLVEKPEEEIKSDDLDGLFTQNIIKQYLSEISNYNLLTATEEIELIKKFHLGDNDAKEILVTSNLRFVIKIAMKYAKPGVMFLDLVQDGTIGLIKAIEKFDIEKGYRLSTYAGWWIKKYIIESLRDKVNSIKIPNYIYLLSKKIEKAEDIIKNRENREATVEEIADYLEISSEEIEKIKRAIRSKAVNISEIETENGESIEFEDTNTEDGIDRALDELARKHRVSNMLKKLNKRERDIIEQYFGLNESGDKHTFKEIGEKMGISAERVRVIKAKALIKLRHLGERIWIEE